VVLGLQPAVICSCDLVEWSAFDHRRSPRQWPVVFRQRISGRSPELEIETIETHRF
jgi:hypothetical protein